MKKERGVSLVSVILILILLAILVVLVWLGIMMMNKDDGEKNIAKANNDESNIQNINDEDNNEEENIEKELDIDSELVQNLYSKVLKSNQIAARFEDNSGKSYYRDELGFECSFYKSSKTTVNDLKNEEKVLAVLQYLEDSNQGEKVLWSNMDKDIINKLSYYVENTDEVNNKNNGAYCVIYDSNVIEKAEKQIFGNNTQINCVSTIGTGFVMEYIDGSYYEYQFPGGGGPWPVNAVSLLQRATEDDQYVYIYDKYLYGIIEDYNNEQGALYTDSDLNEKIGSLKVYEIESINESYINKYKNQLDTFKHTFKKDSSGNYYWVSTEKV